MAQSQLPWTADQPSRAPQLNTTPAGQGKTRHILVGASSQHWHTHWDLSLQRVLRGEVSHRLTQREGNRERDLSLQRVLRGRYLIG